ncbi:MAG: hypothetical protein LUE21_05685, partial [Oscillospiraceae bacterium]|nr:hypothetical protein [Oscillospiraceae bacterium]
MKRIMCLLLALVMVFSLLGVSAFAEETEDDGIATVSEEDEDDGTVPIKVTGATEGLYWEFYNDEISLDSWYGIDLKAGYDVEVTGGTLNEDYYWVDYEGTVVRYRDFIVYSEDAPDEVVINVVASSDVAPTASYVTVQLPSGATTDIIEYGLYDTYVLSGESYSIWLIGAYTLGETAGIEITD